MKEPFSDEILSAYVDGELSPHERAEVERWVEGNAAAREKVDDFRRLAGLFAGLPRTEVPHEFPTTVMQLAERRMLLPETRAVSARGRFGRWVLAAAATVTSAAAVLVIVSLMRQDQGVPDGGHARLQHPAPFDLVSNKNAENRETGWRDESRKSGALVAQREADRLHAERENMSRSTASRSPDAGHAPAAAAPAPPAGINGPGDGSVAPLTAAKRLAAKNPSAGAGGAAPLADDDTPNNRQLAEFNRAIEELDERDAEHELVSVVRLYVVDQAEGMVLLQNIFDDNNVLLERENRRREHDSKDNLPGADRPSEAGEKADEKEVLYVVAEPKQLIAAITTMLSHEDAGVRMAVEEPIEVAALDAGLQEQVKQIAPPLAESENVRRAMTRKETVARDKAILPAEPKPVADGVEKFDSSKADGKSDKKPGPNEAPRGAGLEEIKKKAKSDPSPEPAKPAIASKPGEAAAGEESANGKKGGADNKKSRSVPDKDAAGPPADGQFADRSNDNGRSRQLVVPMPEVIRKRTESGETQLRSADDAAGATLEKATAAASRDRHDEKRTAPVPDDEANRAPSLVRVLIVIEREPARPAGPPGASEPAKKPARDDS